MGGCSSRLTFNWSSATCHRAEFTIADVCGPTMRSIYQAADDWVGVGFEIEVLWKRRRPPRCGAAFYPTDSQTIECYTALRGSVTVAGTVIVLPRTVVAEVFGTN